MKLARFIATVMAASTLLARGAVHSQDYPSRPIRFVTSGVGGGNDFTARLIAQAVSSTLGQPVVVDNRAGGIVSAEVVLKAAPDGYTLLVLGSSFMIGHLLQEAPYDPLRDFSPVTLAAMAPNVVVVHPSLPIKSVKELVALAKARPGELNYGSTVPGTSSHLAGELFKSMAEVNMVFVSYKGVGPALIALLSGEVQMMISSASTSAAHVKSGRLKALAVTTAQPTALVPDIPTVAASGLPGFEVISVDAVFAPAKTPVTIVNSLNREIVKALNRPDIKQKFFDSGAEVVGSSPADLADKTKTEIAKWAKVIKAAGIRAQ